MIKLIVFDLWHTLATREDPYYYLAESIKKEFNLETYEDEIVNVFLETIKANYFKPKIETYKEILKKLGIEKTQENIEKILELKIDSEDNIKVFDFVFPLINKLKEKGYMIGLLTNSASATHKLVKQKTSLLEKIDYQLFSFQIGKVKPEIEMFEEMEKKSNYLKNEILMIGDSYPDDVNGAINAGWNAIHFKDFNQLKRELDKYKIKI